jgi:S1-C subfamily serine protease
MVYSELRQRIRLFPAALLQAIVFGFLHPFDLVHSVLLVGLGFILAILDEWRKTLVAPIILHSLVNVLAIAAITLGLTPSANAPALGVGGEPVDGGCKVTVLGPGSAADEAGIRVGDRITALDGESVSDFRSLARLVLRRNVGDKVTIAFVRDGESQQVEAVLKRRRDSGS